MPTMPIAERDQATDLETRLESVHAAQVGLQVEHGAEHLVAHETLGFAQVHVAVLSQRLPLCERLAALFADPRHYRQVTQRPWKITANVVLQPRRTSVTAW